MSDTSDSTAAHALRRAYQVLIQSSGALDTERTPCGQALAVSQAHALMALLHSPGIRQQDLAQHLSLSKSAVSRMVAQLQSKKWVQRAADRRDGRAKRLRLTPRGFAVAQRVDAASSARFRSILSRLPQGATQEVIAALEVLGRALVAETESRSCQAAPTDYGPNETEAEVESEVVSGSVVQPVDSAEDSQSVLTRNRSPNAAGAIVGQTPTSPLALEAP